MHLQSQVLQQETVATKQAPQSSQEAEQTVQVPVLAEAPEPNWNLKAVKLDGYGVLGEVHEPHVVEAGRSADFSVDLRDAWLNEQHWNRLLGDETRRDEALAVRVRVVEQLERESRPVRVRVVPKQPSDGTYWVRYWPETEGSNILQVEVKVDGEELPASPIIVRRTHLISPDLSPAPCISLLYCSLCSVA